MQVVSLTDTRVERGLLGREALDYDFRTEQEFSYADLTMSESISHLARFVSRLWQLHIFCEGNTRAHG